MEYIKVNSLDEIKNGGPGAYVIDYARNQRYVVIVGKNVNSNSGVMLNGHCGGGRSQVLELTTPQDNAIEVILESPRGGNGYEPNDWRTVTPQFMRELNQTFNLNPNNTSVSGASYSAEMSVKYAANLAQTTGAKNFCATIIESSWSAPVRLTAEEKQALIDNNVTLLNFYQIDSRSVYKHMPDLEGVHVLDVKVRATNASSSDRHILPYYLFMEGGGNKLCSGEFNFKDLPTSYNYYGRKLELEYLFTEHYVDENGNYVSRTLTLDEAQKLIEENGPSNINSLYEKSDSLSEFAKNFNGTGDTLASNLSYVSNAMSGIKSKITEHTDINYTGTGEANIVGTLYKASNYYGAVTNVLYGNLSAETEAVYAIANAIFKMDGAAAVIAESKLTSNMQNLFSSSNPTVSSALNELKNTSESLFDTAKNAVTANGRYDELTSILGNKAEAGNVGKVSITSLESAINSIVPNLENEINKATNIRSGVNDFISNIGSSNILQGETWNAVKTNMENYSNLLDCNVKAATFISDTIKFAMGMVVKYIEDANDTLKKAGTTEFGAGTQLNEIDDSKLPALEEELTKLQKEIDNLSEKVTTLENSRQIVEDKKQNDEGEWIVIGSHQEPSEEEIQGYRDQLKKVQDTKDILDAYAGILRGFAPLVAQAQDIINDAISQVKSSYENPTIDTKGNQTFNSDFKLDFSAYGIDTNTDYKKVIDDYYAKLNPPKPTIDDVLALDAKEPDPVGTKTPEKTGYTGTPGSPSVPSPDPTTPTTQAPTEAQTEAPTSTPTEPETTPVTEPETVPQTEPETVPYTIPVTEPQTDVIVEQKTVPQTEIVKEEPKIQKTSTGGGSSKKPKTSNIDPIENPSEPVIIENNEEIITEPFVEPIVEPAQEEYLEPEIPTEINVEVQEEVIETPQPKKSNGVKTMGIAAGVGLAVGASALGAHAIMKNKENEESDEDYGYDK